MNRLRMASGPDKLLGDNQMRVIIAKERGLIDQGDPKKGHLNEFNDILFYRIISHSDITAIVTLSNGFATGMKLPGVFRFCQTNKKSISEWMSVPQPHDTTRNSIEVRIAGETCPSFLHQTTEDISWSDDERGVVVSCPRIKE